MLPHKAGPLAPDSPSPKSPLGFPKNLRSIAPSTSGQVAG